ncbi:MAG: prolipoprotein diacylglyceryl transferase [Bacteroidales bacterium]|nr:prolipoprotein diacylglyceryl transferase [Bacteroidales bacterium]
MLGYITWTVNPVAFTIPGLDMDVRWYGMMWAFGFLLGYITEKYIYKREGLPDTAIDDFLTYMAIFTVVGARLGHCFFYDPEYYFSHLGEVLLINKGGLSSHGGAVGILIGMYVFSRRVAKKSYLWVLDRTVIAVAITGCCIRFGNLMNHEIYGHATDVPWAFQFVTNLHSWMAGKAEPIFSEPSHPTQIYEMLYCIVTYCFTMYLYWKTNARKYEGLIFAVFLQGIFLTRFLLEFIKNNQESFEDGMMLNMGQLLSVPLFVTGFFLFYKAYKQYKEEKESSQLSVR